MSDCITHSAPEPVFAEPWHAQVFAVTVALNEAGRFDWPDWAKEFGATLARHGVGRDLDGGDDSSADLLVGGTGKDTFRQHYTIQGGYGWWYFAPQDVLQDYDPFEDELISLW